MRVAVERKLHRSKAWRALNVNGVRAARAAGSRRCGAGRASEGRVTGAPEQRLQVAVHAVLRFERRADGGREDELESAWCAARSSFPRIGAQRPSRAILGPLGPRLCRIRYTISSENAYPLGTWWILCCSGAAGA